MDKKPGGFSLTELLLTVLSVGLLSVFAMTQYNGTDESLKMESAKALLEMVAAANHMSYVKDRIYITGPINNDSAMVAGGFIASRDWRSLAFEFEGSDDPAAPCVVAQARHRTHKDLGLCINRDGATGGLDESGRCAFKCATTKAD